MEIILSIILAISVIILASLLEISRRCSREEEKIEYLQFLHNQRSEKKMPKNWKKIYVRCSECKEDFDESKVEFMGIEEDIQGRDIMAFMCPICKHKRKSFRRG